MNIEQYIKQNPAKLLVDAQGYSETTYKEITSNVAEQFFSLAGQMDSLEANVSNTTPCVVITGLTTTVGQVVSAMLRTLAKSSGQFTRDPNKTAGQLNLVAGQVLVDNNIMPAAVVTTFFNLGKVVSTPLATTTQVEFDAAKAKIVLETNPTTLQETTYISGQHLVPVRNERVKVKLTILEADKVDYADVITATAFSKNVDEVEYSEEALVRGNFQIPANWFGIKTFVVNHSNLEPHVKIKLSSNFNRVFTANTFTA